jgi:carboxyl-terminal processing protease
MFIGESRGAVIVDRVFPNTPADEAGVREGDRIVAVDSAPTAGLGVDKVSDMLRGLPGSQVTVTYARPGVPAPIKLRFTRRVVHVPAVAFSTMVGDSVGYIPLQTFNENAADELEAAVVQLEKAGAKGLVLDMRDNPGGIVEQSLAVASLFLREGQDIVSVRARNAPTELSRSSGKHLATDIPLVILVDGLSASASEIVAGALQDHDRALLVGTTTYGKGLVQSLYQLQGGYNLKLTTGKWFTPSGRSIHRQRKLVNGRFVEVHPDSAGADSVTRPTFKSDAGRVVYGGGGIRPDVVVADDTLPAIDNQFLRSLGDKYRTMQTVVQDYALELKGTVSRDFTVPATWTTELLRRVAAAGVTIDPKYAAVAPKLLTRELAHRVASMAFGDAAAKTRSLADDHQLGRALELLRNAHRQADLFAPAK